MTDSYIFENGFTAGEWWMGRRWRDSGWVVGDE